MTLEWKVIRKPVGDIDTSGSEEFATACWIVNIIDNGDGTVTVYYVASPPTVLAVWQ